MDRIAHLVSGSLGAQADTISEPDRFNTKPAMQAHFSLLAVSFKRVFDLNRDFQTFGVKELEWGLINTFKAQGHSKSQKLLDDRNVPTCFKSVAIYL